jgi:hypothetical protein
VISTVVLAKTSTVSDFTKDVGVPLLVAFIALATSIGAAALSFAFGRWSDTTARRRDGYAAAVQELVGWVEYPFRIRRRTSDDADALAELAERGHALQEALRYRQTWIRSENRWVAEIFAAVRADLGAILSESCNEAWAAEPVTKAADMTLAGWGPRDVDMHLRRFERAVGFRFGWRRIPAIVRWHPGA